MFFVVIGSAIALGHFEILINLTQFYNDKLSYISKDTVINS